MKKTVIIASLAVLASAAVVATFALAGAGKFGDVQVNADPVEYSVTFDAKSGIKEDFGKYAICTTTAAGNRVGVVGFNTDFEFLSFGEVPFMELQLHDATCALINAGAYDFGHITGFQVTFTGKLKLRYEVLNEEEETFEEVEQDVESGVKYDVSLTPDDYPAFARDEYSDDVVTITSLTIWYTC
ncbi:MAG: hypothetical protein IJS37_04300 [Bacilli bacterium]|nr:hypothetical protein [Bacilli bacterium]